MRAYTTCFCAVAFLAGVAVGVAGLACLQASACFAAMLKSPIGSLAIVMRFETKRFEIVSGQLAVAGITKSFGFMTAVTLLRIVLRFYRVNADKIAAMAFGLVISPEVALRQIIARAATLMAIKTPFLHMAFFAVVAGLAGQYPVFMEKISGVIGGYAFALVAGVAFLDFHFGVFFMRHFFSVRLLLEIHQGASQKRSYEKDLFH